MRQCRKAMGLLVAVCVLLPAGCASQRGGFAKKKEVNTSQLLAAARQYEKEGQAENAAHLYKHVLRYHPANSEAKHGLALIQQGKLRVDYNTEQLLASTNPDIQKNPQAREMLAQKQKAKKEEVTEQMAQLIASVADQPKKINVDANPTPTMVASWMIEPSESDTSLDETSLSADGSNSSEGEPRMIILEDRNAQVPAAGEPSTVAQADATAGGTSNSPIETTGFTNSDESADLEEELPTDWSTDSPWRPHSLTNHCQDANAAVLTEVSKLDSPVDDVRKEGLTCLARMGTEAAAAAPAIRLLLSDKNQLVAAHAAWAAWEVEQDATAVVETLIELLDSSNTDIVQFAAYTIGGIGQPAESATDKLQQLLAHDESVTQLHAAEALIHIAGPEVKGEAIDTLSILLKDDDAEVRSLAAMMLGVADSNNTAFAVASLISALDDEDDQVRLSAALSLGAFGSDAEVAVNKLQEISQQDHTDVREAAQTALSCIQL